MPTSAPEDSAKLRLVRLGGLAAFLGGWAWAMKGVAILVSGAQPPLLFEGAPMLFGLGLLSVAYSTMSASARRSWVLASAALSTATGLAALASDLVGEVWGSALAVSSLALLVGLLILPRRGGWPAPLGWWIGMSTVPALVVGGALSAINERLLEIPLTCLGLAWMVLGWAAFKSRAVASPAVVASSLHDRAQDPP